MSAPPALAALAAWILAVAPPPAPSAEPVQTSAPSALGVAQREAANPEGPLESTAFLPVSAAAGERLVRGDAALVRARAESDARRLDEALEAWHDAAGLEAPPGAPDAVDHPGGPGEPDIARRAAVGIEDALLARLEALTPTELATWTARFASLADAELAAAAERPEALAALDRRHPGTLAAARAALRLADRDLERGGVLAARTWSERGLRHTALLRDEARTPALAAALERRRRAAAGALGHGEPWRWSKPSSSETEPASTAESGATPDTGPLPLRPVWKRATQLVALGRLPLDLHVLPQRHAAPGQGVRPGLAFLEDGRAAVQTSREVIVLDDRLTRVQSRFDPARLLRESLGSPPRVHVSRGTPGWPLVPRAFPDGDLLLVVGRAHPVGGGNALLRVRPPEPLPGGDLPLDEGAVPHVVWALGDGLRARAGSDPERVPELGDLAGAEFQPGPVIVGGRVLVQVRTLEGVVASWLVCFDADDGSLLWRRLLAQGADVGSEAERLGGSGPAPGAAQPLLALDGRVFAGTHLGVGALVDTIDGRLRWSLRNRRRPPTAAGLDGGVPLVAPGSETGPDAGLGALLAWGPADSDHLYWLRDAPLPAGPVRLVPPPRAVGEGQALVALDAGGALVVTRAGPARAVSRWDAETGGRSDSLHLSRGELFPARGLASEERLWIASDRALYLFDRERDTYLLDSAPLSGEAPRGGAVYARGDRVLVLGDTSLWGFGVN